MPTLPTADEMTHFERLVSSSLDLTVTGAKQLAGLADKVLEAARRPPRESLSRCHSHVKLHDAISRESRVTWDDGDGDLREGILRRGAWTEGGQLASFPRDPRDCLVRVTMRSGSERWIAWSNLIESLEEERLAFDW